MRASVQKGTTKLRRLRIEMYSESSWGGTNVNAVWQRWRLLSITDKEKSSGQHSDDTGYNQGQGRNGFRRSASFLGASKRRLSPFQNSEPLLPMTTHPGKKMSAISNYPLMDTLNSAMFRLSLDDLVRRMIKRVIMETVSLKVSCLELGNKADKTTWNWFKNNNLYRDLCRILNEIEYFTAYTTHLFTIVPNSKYFWKNDHLF